MCIRDRADGINGKIAAARAGIEAVKQAEEEARKLAQEQENAKAETKEYGPGTACLLYTSRQLQYSIQFGDVLYITSSDGAYELELHYIAVIQ